MPNRNDGATLVITHRVLPGREREYEAWLEEIRPVSKSSLGHMDWQLVRPVPGVTSTYSAILRFDSRSNMDNWLSSDTRKQLIEKVRPLLVDNENLQVRSGLDFLFSDSGSARAPLRWKQFLATWAALYPLSLTLPMVLLPVLRKCGLPPFRPLDIFLLNGVTVALMVYWVMPRFTKLVHRWLFK